MRLWVLYVSTPGVSDDLSAASAFSLSEWLWISMGVRIHRANALRLRGPARDFELLNIMLASTQGPVKGLMRITLTGSGTPPRLRSRNWKRLWVENSAVASAPSERQPTPASSFVTISGNTRVSIESVRG